jgi:hypothetical protein
VGFSVTFCAKSNKILDHIIAQAAPRLNVMDLKIFHAPAGLTTPAVTLQNFPAELTISFRIKSQTWPLRANSGQSVPRTSSRSCFR